LGKSKRRRGKKTKIAFRGVIITQQWDELGGVMPVLPLEEPNLSFSLSLISLLSALEIRQPLAEGRLPRVAFSTALFSTLDATVYAAERVLLEV
jgi:hypothetical protein